MKIRPLPDIDLARIAPLSTEQKRIELNRFELKRPQLSYGPLRKSLFDILNTKIGMVDLPQTPWTIIVSEITKNSRSTKEKIANLQIAEGLYAYARATKLLSRSYDLLPLALGVNQRVTYWHSLILVVDDLPLVPFFDPRRSPRLTADARRFVFSTMHERIRVAYPDLAHVQLAIFQFRRVGKKSREPLIFTDENVNLFSFKELDEMVRETYELWREISQERQAGMRRKAGGERGSLI